jgi:DNA primase large subunit
MKTKFTLTMNDRVIDSAKKYARKKGESLSRIVENYLKSITNREASNLVISDKVKKMMGMISLPYDFDYKKELGSAVVSKYK